MPEETGANSSGERGTSGSADVLRWGGVSGETGAGEPTLTYPPYPNGVMQKPGSDRYG
jgi:hypothetical protein